jgi:hypothetical protein
VTGINFVDDLVVYNKKASVDADVKVGYVASLKTKTTILEGDKDNVEVDVKGYGYNQITVKKTFEENGSNVTKLAVYNKKGEKLIDFNKDYVDKFTTLYEDIFVLNGCVYKNSDKIIDGTFNNAYFDISNKDRIVYATSSFTNIYDLNGKFIYTYVNVTGVDFYVLSSNKGLYVTEYTDLPLDATDYTYCESIAKVKVVYELVDFASGNKSTVPFGYLIDSVYPVSSEAGEPESNYSIDAKGLIRITGTQLQGKLLSKTTSTVFVDENLNIKKVYDNEGETYISSSRKIWRDGTSYRLVDGDGQVLRTFASTATWNNVAKLILSGSNYYDTDGKLVINNTDYTRLDSFTAYGGAYAYAEKKVGDKTQKGFVNASGTFTMVFETDGKSALETKKEKEFVLIIPTTYPYNYAYLYGIRDKGATKWTVKNFSGTTLLESEESIFVTRSYKNDAAYQAVVDSDGKTTIRIFKA